MKIKALLFAMLLPGVVFAQVTEGVQSFAEPEGAWKRSEADVGKPVVLDRFVNDVTQNAINNIVNAEQVFCYEVLPQNEEFDGYTINHFPIKGFCGVLGNQVRDMIVQYFLSQGSGVDFENQQNCVIQPKVMVRFVRGVDNTDMLISSPCYSFALFYAGSIGVYNFAPGSEIIDTLLTALNDKHQEFVSPALLNQLMPIGVVQNEQQRNLVTKKVEPIRAWEQQVKEDEAKKQEEQKKSETGWNKLKIQLKP